MYKLVSFHAARPTTSVSYGYKGSLVATGVAVAICVVGLIAAVVRRALLTSARTRNTLGKTIAAASPRSPLNKSTATLAGDADESSEIREVAEEEAGFGSSKVTCVVTNIAAQTPTEILQYSGNQSTMLDDEFKLSRTSVLINNSSLSEHQLLPQDEEKFYSRRDSPDGKVAEKLRKEVLGSPSQIIPDRNSDGWLDFVSGDATPLTFTEPMQSQTNYR